VGDNALEKQVFLSQIHEKQGSFYLTALPDFLRKVRMVVGSIFKKKEATQRGKTASPFSLVTVLTTATENREQEVMLSSPVSLAPLRTEQSRCHGLEITQIGYVALISLAYLPNPKLIQGNLLEHHV
jgi:hypothetical protein